MSIRIAMPIAHQTAGDYASFYDGPDCVIVVGHYFNQAGCQGFNVEHLPGAGAPTDRWNLYAFSDGFLSFQDNALVLRLPRELNATAVAQYNSGHEFRSLTPQGAQLRHVEYLFPVIPSALIENAVRSLLNDIGHPGRTITRVANPVGGIQTLEDFLLGGASNVDLVIHEFMAGVSEIFVQAGDVIGNFYFYEVEIRFRDSCGSSNPGAGNITPVVPTGRPLNPAYYLHLVRSAVNTTQVGGTAARVDLLTHFIAPVGPPTLADTHPLDHLLSAAAVAAAGASAEVVLDLTVATPAKPLHAVIDVQDSVGNILADRGISIAALGEWHESRNASNPYSTPAPVQWRNYGNEPADTAAIDYIKFRSQVKTGQTTRLPGGVSFDHDFVPSALHDRVEIYWARYAPLFNAVATALEVPCDLLVAIACKETAGGAWYNAIFASTDEMGVIRMEPLQISPAAITPNVVHQGYLADYSTITGGIRGAGANANIPIPWNGAAVVELGNALTWDQLRTLIGAYPARARVSPGVMQTLVGTAHADMDWVASVYAATYIHTIVATVGGVVLTTDDPPANQGDLFGDWFGVSVDAAGANTNDVALVDITLSKHKRALHSIVAGAAHIKRRYNTIENNSNLICDFDFPTVASGYNDGASSLRAAALGASDDEKWRRLFAMLFFGGSYPEDGPRFFNAVVNYFNTGAALPRPAVRLWRP